MSQFCKILSACLVTFDKSSGIVHLGTLQLFDLLHKATSGYWPVQHHLS